MVQLAPQSIIPNLLARLMIVTLLSVFISPPRNCFAQNSIIQRILEARKSIVHINAIRNEVFVSPHAEAKIIPQTNKIIVARNIKAAQLNKAGAGIIIHSSGFIITNLHTINLADKILVKLYNGQAVWASVVQIAQQDDLALLKINPPMPLEAMAFADSNKVRIGEEVITIGSSELLDETISSGRITGLARNQWRRLSDNIIVQLIQVNINLYEGDSGGPLLNSHGQLIGLIVAKNNKTDKTSYAIPSNKINSLCLDFLN